jgi:septal ring factor EnvC (AmiA/AmiB activator)
VPVSENDAIIDRLEQLGPNQVRLLVSNGGLPTSWNVRIAEWLAIKDQEERRLIASSQSEQMDIARAASAAAERAAAAAERASVAAERKAVAAERANTRATIALAIAIISIIATVTGMIVVHFDTIRQLDSG